MLAMHKQLQAEFPKTALPKFPPKRWLRNTSFHVITDRKHNFNLYFSKLLAVPGLCTSPTLVQALCSTFSCRIAVLGCPRMGKTSLVDAFCLAKPMHRHAKVDLTLSSSELMTTRGPIDIIAEDNLIRISKIETFTIREDTDYIELIRQLRKYEAVLVTFAPNQPHTSEIAGKLMQMLKHIIVSVVGLGSGEVTSVNVQSADREEEVYNIFEQLAYKAFDVWRREEGRE
jgi:hypothetical protein